MSRLPNFLYIGPDKAGSSWLHEALLQHPQICLSPAKDLYFFDRYYDRGLGWYAAQFKQAGAQHLVVGEVCPDYLAEPLAADRIQECLGDVRLMVTLREPSSRAYSSYLYMRKHGLGPHTFRRALETFPDLLEHGRYATQLRRFRDYYDKGLLHISLFDELQADPQNFLDGVTDFLGLQPVALEPQMLSARLPASRARFVPLAWVTRRGAEVVRWLDGARVVGRVKRSPLVQRALYRPLGEAAPGMAPEDQAYIKDRLGAEVDALEGEFGLALRARWGW